MEYYNSVNRCNRWLKAGRPHNKPFLIVRECTKDAANVNEDVALKGLCTLIIWYLNHHCAETRGSGYRIEPAPSTIHNARPFDHKGFTFTVYTEPTLYPGPSKVRLSARAIATILS